ncbi:MAG TPA: STAS domain-containing protein [Streptosporangiaceae bacterium]|nr:STAS domain-containing protein [Streptosporangiaceae bacterium]
MMAVSSRPRAAKPRSANPRATDPRAASQLARQIICLRVEHELCEGNADALAEVMDARMRAAIPLPCSVVLDLSATPALDDCVSAALQSLHQLLAGSLVHLWLVLPGVQARAAFLSCCAGEAIGPDSIHTSVRTAMLAAYANLPGAALVTSAHREFLAQPPELLAVPDWSSPP